MNMIFMNEAEYQAFQKDLSAFYVGRYSVKITKGGSYILEFANLEGYEGYHIGKIIQMELMLNHLENQNKKLT